MERQAFTIAADGRRDHLSAYGGENRAASGSPTVYVQNASRTVGVVCAATLGHAARQVVARAQGMKRCVSSMGVKPRTPPVTRPRRAENDLAFDWKLRRRWLIVWEYRRWKPVSRLCATTSTGRRSSLTPGRWRVNIRAFWKISGRGRAQRLFKDANELLDKLSARENLNPRGVVGLFPANRVGDDIGNLSRWRRTC